MIAGTSRPRRGGANSRARSSPCPARPAIGGAAPEGSHPVEAPIADGFRNVRRADGGRIGEVGDRARDLEDAVVRTRRQRQPCHRLREERGARGVGRAVRFDFARAEARIGLALPLDSAARGRASPARGRPRERPSEIGTLRVSCACGELLRRHRGNLDAEVDPVEQRPGHAAAIAGDAIRRAMAASALVPEPAAGARVHRGDELELRGESALPRRARDVDDARLQRLAQRVEHATVPFGQLVEEQHAVMGERDLARVADRCRRR